VTKLQIPHTDITIVVKQHAIVGQNIIIAARLFKSGRHDFSALPVSARFGTMTQSLQQKANAVVASSIVHSIRKTMYDDRTNQEGDTQLCAGHEGPDQVAWAACCCNYTGTGT
jgi:hypothetical protein